MGCNDQLCMYVTPFFSKTWWNGKFLIQVQQAKFLWKYMEPFYLQNPIFKGCHPLFLEDLTWWKVFNTCSANKMPSETHGTILFAKPMQSCVTNQIEHNEQQRSGENSESSKIKLTWKVFQKSVARRRF